MLSIVILNTLEIIFSMCSRFYVPKIILFCESTVPFKVMFMLHIDCAHKISQKSHGHSRLYYLASFISPFPATNRKNVGTV